MYILNIINKLMVCSFLMTALSASAETISAEVSIMSLNIFGWKTMPQHSGDYAALINSNNVEIVAIQEGVDDWQLSTQRPTDYSRAIALQTSLGDCWTRRYQLFINHCAGSKFIESGRFDLTDGPNATRTGEFAIIQKLDVEYLVVNIHWDHESQATRIANAGETAALINSFSQYPAILLGDFNAQCDSAEVNIVAIKANMTLLKSAGIDCVFSKALVGVGKVISALPSDHQSIIATVQLKAPVKSKTSVSPKVR